MKQQLLWLEVTNLDEYYGEMQELMCECGHPVRTHSQYINMNAVITNDFPISVFPKVCLSCLRTKKDEDVCQRWRGLTKRAGDTATPSDNATVLHK